MPKFTVEPAEVVREHKVVAVVGASKNPEKDAYTVPEYLQQHGYTVIPVNPTTDSINGLKTYPSLSAIPDDLAKKIEVVDVFRPSEEFPEIANQVVQLRKRTGMPVVFWGQEGLENEKAKKILSEVKIDYVMDKCMRVEHQLMESSR